MESLIVLVRSYLMTNKMLIKRLERVKQVLVESRDELIELESEIGSRLNTKEQEIDDLQSVIDSLSQLD
jgi:hypothetical protein